jgi:hypothetical protein
MTISARRKFRFAAAGLGFICAACLPSPLRAQWVTGSGGIGIANPANKLSVNGTIGAKEVMVASSGADYVFDRDYRLAPLSEIADFVAENHHLPDIPSAREVEEKGVSLGDMQSKLLAKIEELTLHMIQAGERSDRLERENAELRDRMLRLETGVQPLQASGSAERK